MLRGVEAQTAPGLSSATAAPRLPNPLLDDRRHLIALVGRAVVWQALEIGPEQVFLGRWECAVFSAIDFAGKHEDEVAVVPAVLKTIRRPGHLIAVCHEDSQLGVVGGDQPVCDLRRR